MTGLLICVLAWPLLSIAVAVLIGRGIRIADEKAGQRPRQEVPDVRPSVPQR